MTSPAGLDAPDPAPAAFPRTLDRRVPPVVPVLPGFRPITDRALEATMTTTPTTDPPAHTLTTNDAILVDDEVHQILGVHPDSSRDRVLIVTVDTTGHVDAHNLRADRTVTLATPQQIAQAADVRHRNAVADQIEALAHLVRTRRDLPVPTSVVAQHSLVDVRPENADIVAGVAVALKVDPSIGGRDASARSLMPGAGRVEYVIHGFLPAGGADQ